MILTSDLYSQVKTKPDDPKNPTCDECFCIPQTYPQASCIEDPNVVFSKNCTTIPLPNGFSQKNRRFLKRNLPICFSYDDSEFPLVETKRLIKGFEDTEPLDSYNGARDTILGGISSIFFFPIFKLSSIYNTINENSLLDRVFKEWKRNCPTNEADTSVRDSTEPCCVQVQWSSRFEDFLDQFTFPEEVQNVIAQTKRNTPSASVCDNIQFPCTTKILINVTRAFLNPDKFSGYDAKMPTKFFFTDSIPSGVDPITNLDYTNDIEFFSLEDVLLHELGHVLGFEHTTDSCSDTTSKTIMAPTQRSHTKYGLSWQDRCAYKRANCCPIPPSTPMIRNGSACDLASTVEQIKKLQALSYPNPADQWVFVPTTAEGNYSVEIYDYVGRQYFNGSLESFDSKIGIPVGHLANGNYVIRVTMSKNIQDFSIVISR